VGRNTAAGARLPPARLCFPTYDDTTTVIMSFSDSNDTRMIYIYIVSNKLGVGVQRLSLALAHWRANGVRPLLFLLDIEFFGRGTWAQTHDVVHDPQARAYQPTNLPTSVQCHLSLRDLYINLYIHPSCTQLIVQTEMTETCVYHTIYSMEFRCPARMPAMPGLSDMTAHCSD
jgi:hypothetical protein